METIKTVVLFRPSTLGQLMTNPVGKSFKEKYMEQLAKVQEIHKQLEEVKEWENDHEVKRKGQKSPAQKYKEIRNKLEKEDAKLPELKDKAEGEIYLSETAKKMLKAMVAEIRYGRKKRLQNKYVKKGLAVENASLELYSEFKGEEFSKNPKRKTNDYFTGEVDILLLDKYGKEEECRDIKSRYDIDSFMDHIGEEMNKDNKCQLLAYCDIFGTSKATIANCLTNNDFGLIRDEIRRAAYEFKPEELTDSFNVPLWRIIEIAKDQIFDYITFIEFLRTEIDGHELRLLKEGSHPNEEAQQMFNSFVEIPLDERVIEQSIEADEDEIEAIKSRCELAREYLKKVWNIEHEKEPILEK